MVSIMIIVLAKYYDGDQKPIPMVLFDHRKEEAILKTLA